MPARTAYALGTPPIWHGAARNEKVLGGVIPIVIADLTAGNTVNLFKAPAGFVIAGAAIDFPALDAGNTLTLSIGTPTTPALLLNASTSGRAGAPGVAIAAGARGTKLLVDTDIVLTAVAGAGTPAVGNVVVFLFGYIDGP